MRNILASIGTLLMLGTGIFPASGASISVSPTSVEMTAPTAASQLTLRNASDKAVNVQVRVFRWSQEGGKERLEPTKSVVASPPSAKMAPGQEYVVRVVRVSKTPVKGEESYRLLVDEIPQKGDAAPGTISLVVRQSIPVFFSEDGATAPDVTWTVGRANGRTVLTARNEGATRLKIHDLNLTQGGKSVANSKGLVGYVLAGSEMTFPLAGKSPAGSQVTVKAGSNMGPFEATATVKGR